MFLGKSKSLMNKLSVKTNEKELHHWIVIEF